MSDQQSPPGTLHVAAPYQLTCTNPACQMHGQVAHGPRCPHCGLRNHLVLPPQDATPLLAGPPIQHRNSLPPQLAPPGQPVSAGEVLSRLVFGGFWALVTIVLTIAALAGLAAGQPGGLLGLPLAALTGLYSRYILRGGRFRILFW